MPHKLLVADDSVTIQRVIELTFADEDIQVIAVGDGKEAIRRVQSDRPDIVLADVGMPERDGYEVTAFIKGTPQFAHIPVLLLTGAFEPIDEGRVRAAGCDGVLVKPFEPQLVISRVKDLISEGRAAVTPPASTDDYFDRLDAAFSSLDGRHSSVPASQAPLGSQSFVAHPPPKGAASEEAAPGYTGLSDEFAGWHPEISVSLADAFAALLAAEQGQAFSPATGSMRAPDDALIERITQRVIERIGNGAVKDTVLEVAERLVRQEIERIKSHVR